MDRRIIHTPLAPAAIGTYNQGVVAGGLVFTAGQIPLNPQTGRLVKGDFASQIDQVLHNINGILSAAGSDLSKAVKFTVFLTDLGRFAEVNAVFERHFSGLEPPARSVVEVAALPMGAEIEIECVAAIF
jgi:2-iminobutanoate/2-iminopropanoate deaminase